MLFEEYYLHRKMSKTDGTKKGDKPIAVLSVNMDSPINLGERNFQIEMLIQTVQVPQIYIVPKIAKHIVL